MNIQKNVLRLLKGAGVGGLATLADLASLTVLVELVHVAPRIANVPALAAGALVQFLGCRHALFEDAKEGSLRKQIGGFALTEVGTLILNAALFHVLVSQTAVPYLAARLVVAFVVFAGFSYPLWRKVFRGSSQSLRPT